MAEQQQFSQPPSATSSRPTSSAGPAAADSKAPAPTHINTTSSSAISSTATTPTSTPRPPKSKDPLQASPAVSKRSSFAENLRTYPPSPRFSRNPSFSAGSWQDLFMNSPHAKPNGADAAKFKGRDWRTIQVHEIVDPLEVRFVELDTSIEDTTKLLIKSGAPNVVMVRESTVTNTAVNTFDYSDLNAYLLLVLGLSQPDETAKQLAGRARTGEAILLKDVLDHLGTRELPAIVPHTARLTQAIEVLGGGAHRLIVCKEGTSEVLGILTQLRMVRFFWENHSSFQQLEPLYGRGLRDLRLGVKEVLAINGDKPLSDALQLMHNEGITSLPVLDNQRNVIGNISHVDTRLLTDSSSIPLLSSTCIHFISVILSERGMLEGKDSYPVFHVTPWSTLAHTVAKLCATRSHRMWIVDAPSPASSVPPSPGLHHAQPAFTDHRASINGPPTHLSAPGSHHIAVPPSTLTEATPGPPYTSTNPGISPSASQAIGGTMSGRLNGVISLTDVLNLYALASGLSPEDPEESRRRRRRSSSSSIRPSIDGIRPSGEFLRESGEISRSASSASKR
ncbi:hypothetical protein K431DRAFT_234432 [Polychaeton citri CBS 116435]|uniref:CBS domain-containing protein n=1 Tax=Polychaeton citri CBS 116435 TaxID=1314669 RepID=A0A9P4ULE4_9PEZI|nr:hypothetical protein K431DRAFT_234432 [Polychaeton citri CBS 116435]